MSIYRMIEGQRVRIPHEVAVGGPAAIEEWLARQAPEQAPEPDGDEIPDEED